MINNRNFFLLWTGKFVSELGDKLYAIAIAWWILEESGMPIYMGLYLAFSVLPGLIVGIFSGAYIDRLNIKMLIVVMDVLRGIIIFWMGLLYLSGNLNIWHTLLSATFISVASSFFNPAIITIIPRLVDKESLSKANAFIQLVDGISTVIGPALGASIVIMLGYTWVFLLNGFSFLLSAIFECFLETKYKKQSSDLAAPSVYEDVKEGFKYLKQHVNMKVLMLIISLAHFFIGAIVVVMPFLARSISSDGILYLGYMEMALGSGFIIGAILTGNKKTASLKNNRLYSFLITVGVCFIFIGVVSLRSIDGVIVYVIMIMTIGYAIVNASIYWQTFIQSNVPENMLGRMSAIASIIGDATLPLSYALFGLLLNFIQFEYLMIICGFALVILLTIFIRFVNDEDVSKDVNEGKCFNN